MSRSALLFALPLFLLAGGCGNKNPVVPPSDSGDAGTDADTDTDGGDTDTGSQGTDADGDGFTVEEGDCDDNDIGVNPGREEDVFDGVDNDCDGRVDEEWSGVTVAQQSRDRSSSIVVFDTVSRIDA